MRGGAGLRLMMTAECHEERLEVGIGDGLGSRGRSMMGSRRAHDWGGWLFAFGACDMRFLPLIPDSAAICFRSLLYMFSTLEPPALKHSTALDFGRSSSFRKSHLSMPLPAWCWLCLHVKKLWAPTTMRRQAANVIAFRTFRNYCIFSQSHLRFFFSSKARLFRDVQG